MALNWHQTSPTHGDWPIVDYGHEGSPNCFYVEDTFQLAQGTEFWQPANCLPTHGLHYGHSPSDNQINQDPWQHVRYLQSNVERLEVELSSLRHQVNEQRIRGELDAERDRLKRELSSLDSQSAEDQDDMVSSPDTSRSTASQPKRRKYQRRPKPDHNAPVKPLTAYAQFAVDIRKQFSSQGLSFAEIAKRIGVKWQEMPDDIRDRYLTRSADEKQKYEMKLRRYQDTVAYREYNQYLANFKAKSGERIKAEHP